MKKKIFIAGGGGCVGHYLYDHLASNPDYELYLLLRSPEKVLYPLDRPNINVIKDEFSNIKEHRPLLEQMDYAINLIADWGNTYGNYEDSSMFFDILENSKCEKIIYFSTASILGPDNLVNDYMERIGTNYIKGKYLMYKRIKSSPVQNKTTILFPTWVLGGDRSHPMSHAYNAIRNSKKWLRLIRLFSIDIKFHFIHGNDMAMITSHLLRSSSKSGEFVLGNPAVSADAFIDEICSFFNISKLPKLRVNPDKLLWLPGLFGKKLSEWDLHCIRNRDLVFKSVNCGHFGLRSSHSTLKEILSEIFSQNETS